MTEWTIDDASQMYRLAHWGGGYVDVNAEGHLVMRPHRRTDQGIDMYELVRHLREENINLPVLVRFNDILHDRVDTLCDVFKNAMSARNYHGSYSAVYTSR